MKSHIRRMEPSWCRRWLSIIRHSKDITIPLLTDEAIVRFSVTDSLPWAAGDLGHEEIKEKWERTQSNNSGVSSCGEYCNIGMCIWIHTLGNRSWDTLVRKAKNIKCEVIPRAIGFVVLENIDVYEQSCRQEMRLLDIQGISHLGMNFLRNRKSWFAARGNLVR